MTPQALRRRPAHGHIYPVERIDTALGNYFREGNLTALRELALLWVTDRVEEGLDRYRAEHGITGTWAALDRIVVARTGAPRARCYCAGGQDRRPGRRPIVDRRACGALRWHGGDIGDGDRAATAARRAPRRQPATHRRRRHRRHRPGNLVGVVTRSALAAPTGRQPAGLAGRLRSRHAAPATVRHVMGTPVDR
jgi:hypothetical protein